MQGHSKGFDDDRNLKGIIPGGTESQLVHEIIYSWKKIFHADIAWQVSYNEMIKHF